MTENICKNCQLFNKSNSTCRVVVLYDGQRIKIPVDPNEECFFDNEFIALDPQGNEEVFKVEAEEVRFWVEDPKTGLPTDGKGIVKIKYPENGFFSRTEKE